MTEPTPEQIEALRSLIKDLTRGQFDLTRIGQKWGVSDVNNSWWSEIGSFDDAIRYAEIEITEGFKSYKSRIRAIQASRVNDTPNVSSR